MCLVGGVQSILRFYCLFSLASLNRYMSSWLKAPVFFSLFQCLAFPVHIIFRFSSTVGENRNYLLFDREHNPLACLLFGSAAWKCTLRDDFIGWDANTREDNLNFLTNNLRFLILPWVRVAHLVNHILERVIRRIGSDWLSEIRPPHLSAFKPLWNGKAFKAFVTRLPIGFMPVKDIYLYPLTERFREALNQQRLDRKERGKMEGNRYHGMPSRYLLFLS